MSIGSKIKALRRAKDLTQEELAEVLGVSSKAVSQWECGRTAPDISQLPVLCNFFEVTADELLEIDVFNKTAELDKIADEYMALGKNGRTKEALFLLKESLKRFPNNAWLMGMIIGESTVLMNTQECDSREKEQMEEECRGYSEHILEHSLEDEQRYTAINFLCFYYKRKGETEKAWEYARKLPHLFDSREFVTPELCDGSEKVEAERFLKFTLFGRFARSMLANYQLDSGEWLYTEEERMELRDKKFALFSLMFERGDYGFFNEHLAASHEMQAREYAKRQNREKCLYHLEQAVESAIRFIGYMNNESFVHTSLLWKQYDSPSQGVSLSERENIATIILSRTKFPEYDSVRAHAGFVALTKKLSEYAGENDY
ncbi:MAG: helix-turn-helix transcriptional regulator [Lachnospiraceae bacterium]|nr:helix-turn-helix transcriptional regulator [Lachnospiraceae bacterium]